MAGMGNLQHVRLGSNLAGTRLSLPQVGTSRPTAAVSLRVTCGQRLTGKVVSNKMDKTAVVEVERLVQHRIYKKLLKRTTKYFAHDEGNNCQLGDEVLLVPCRPLSKKKRFVVSRVTEESDLPQDVIATPTTEDELPEELAENQPQLSTSPAAA